MYPNPHEINLEVANILFPEDMGFHPVSIKVEFRVDSFPLVTATGHLTKDKMAELVSVIRKLELGPTEVVDPDNKTASNTKDAS